MTRLASSITFGKALCELVGLDPKLVRRLDVSAAVNEAPVVRAEMSVPATGTVVVQRFSVVLLEDEGGAA